MREIGGYFQLEEFTGCEYYHYLLRFNTVRNAIEYLIGRRGYKRILIPKYLCDSISGMLERIKVEYDYYEIDSQLRPLVNHVMEQDECIIVVNYFGLLLNGEIKDIQGKYKNIIIDNTQAFFQRPVHGVDTVYACRKYFGVPDGAYLSTDCDCSDYCGLPMDMSHNRMGHLLGRAEEEAEVYYNDFKRNDKGLSGQKVKRMSRITQNILKGVNYSRVLEIRESNFRFIHMALAEINELNVNRLKGNFMYPFLYREGERLRDRLIKKKVYIPILWPNVLEKCRKGSWENYLARNLVCIPVDQRYGIEDMNYIVESIWEIMNEEP